MREWEKNIRTVEPYVPGEQPKDKNIIKLNTNENPYPPAPSVLEAQKELDCDKYRLYPDPVATELIEAIGEQYGLASDQIFPGVGSDDVLAMIFLTFFNSSKPILFPDITYSFYSVWANVYGIPYERPALDENFQIIARDYYKANGGVVIANPNAPTSIYQSLDFIRDVLDHNQDSIVVVDEAYIDFGGESSIGLLKEYENLIVVQTYSKSRSLAGLRIGYAMASSFLIKALNDVKYSVNSYTMNYPSIRLGTEAMKAQSYYDGLCQQVIATREETRKALEALGFSCLPSSANFLFATHKGVAAKTIFEELREAGIFVRYFNLPRIDQYLRITIGTPEQMAVFLEFVKKYQ